MIDASAIILAGGKSQRMQINKPFLRLGKVYLIEIVINKLKEIFDKIIIVTNKKNYSRMISLFGFGVKVLQDKVADKGPMAGLYAGLLSSEYPSAFVVACDMPFLNKSLIQYMADRRGHYDIVIPESACGHFEMLYGFYTHNCLATIDNHLKKNELNLKSLLPCLNVRYISPEEIKKFDPQIRSFTNINTREDLSKFKNGIFH
ncbi:MAG: molybdenum cofactor guanylyltransferase [Elusimicrobia bacterium]|nr:molybdenum cofactor guanylyltransferase [Elusimicrobiota bacterium]